MRAPLNVLPEPGGPWIGKIDGSLHNDATKSLLSFVSCPSFTVLSMGSFSALGFRRKSRSLAAWKGPSAATPFPDRKKADVRISDAVVDITFSPSAEGYKRRRKTHRYHDFRMLPDRADEKILFFGGKDYLPLFCSLTAAIKTGRTAFYNSMRAAGDRLRVQTLRNKHAHQLALRMCQRLP
jgi:hypothetical protein